MEVDGYQMPDDLYYQKGFMWARITGNVARVGLMDYAQKLAGEISYTELPFVGDDVVAGAEVGTVETGKWVGKLYAPMSGKIIAINEKLNDDPTVMNKDPYWKGWNICMGNASGYNFLDHIDSSNQYPYIFL